jgi:hypothetical protein
VSTVAVPIDVLAGRPDTTNTPETVYIAGTNFPADGIAFTSGGSKALYLKIGAELYGNSGNWTLDLHWYSRSGSTSGNVNWVAAMAAITPGDAQSVETKAFATSQNVTTTVNATAKGMTLTSITISNLDNVNAGDDVWIKVTRGSDTMTGDAIFVRASASYQDGSTGTAGSGDFVGPASATSTAVVLFNGTTGKLGMNSVVLIDGSGNMTGIASLNSGIITPSTARLSSAFTSSGTSQQDITGTSITVPAAGTYLFEYYLSTANSSTTGTMSFAVNATGGTISGFQLQVQNPTTTTNLLVGTSTTNGTAATGGARTVTTAIPVMLIGSFACTSSGSVVARVTMSANTVTIAVGSWGRLIRTA